MTRTADPGVALKELSFGHAVKPNTAPVDLGELTGNPNGVQVGAQSIVGPGAIQAPNALQLQQLAVSEGGSQGAHPEMTLEQAEAIVKSLGAGEVQIGPTTQAGANAQTPTQSTPTIPGASIPGAVDLDRLAEMQAQAVQAASAQAAHAQAAAAVEAGAAGNVQTQPIQQVNAQQSFAQQSNLQQQTERVVVGNDVIVDTPFGPMPFGQAKGLMMRRKEFEDNSRRLAESRRGVEAQQHLIERISQSKFGAAFTAVMNAGGSEEEAIQAALAAKGVAIARPVEVAESPLVAPVDDPANPDPNFQAKWAQYLAEITARTARNTVRAEMEPFRQQALQQEENARQEAARQQTSRTAQQQVLDHNRGLYNVYISPALPQGLDQAQQQIVGQYLDEVARTEGIPIDTSRQMSDSDFRLLATYAFPAGQLPPQVIARLTATGMPAQQGAYSQNGYQAYPQNGYQQPAYPQQTVYPQNGSNNLYYQPSQNGYGYTNGAASNGQQPNGQQSNGAAPNGVQGLPSWQQTALLQQAQAVLAANRAHTQTGVMPGIPVNPALQAGPNPSASSIGSQGVQPMMRPEQRIQSQMQSLTRMP